VIFLQHPRERDVAIGTARMAHLALAGSRLLEGLRFDEHPEVQPLLPVSAPAAPARRVAVLFPGEGARPLDEWLKEAPDTLIVLDGTWTQARKLLKLNPRLAALPRLAYTPPAPGNYRIRREPAEDHLATVEAVAAVLGALEGEPERYEALLRPFEVMVDRQIAAAMHSGARPRRRRPARAQGRSRLPELAPLLVRPAAAVLLYAEANCHPPGSRAPGAPELLHLVASRPATGERFEAVLAPRRPLGDDTPRHLGLARDALEHGERAPDALARFRDFLADEPPSTLCAWGAYPRDLLLREGEPAHGFVDLRALAARSLGRSPGGIRGCAEAFELLDDVPDAARAGADRLPGRAGAMLALLERIYARLLHLSRAEASGHEREAEAVGARR
jgi:DTW domain-containing protein